MEANEFWKITLWSYIILSLAFIFGGQTFLGRHFNKIHDFFKKIISFPLINLFPILIFMISYAFVLFTFYDNVGNSVLLYYRPKWLTILLLIVESQPVFAMILLLFCKNKLDSKKSSYNYCYQKKRHYVYVFFFEKNKKNP